MHKTMLHFDIMEKDVLFRNLQMSRENIRQDKTFILKIIRILLSM